MRYFELMSDKEISYPLRIQKLDTKLYRNGLAKEKFLALPPLSVGYFDDSIWLELYDVLSEPAFMISDSLKSVFMLYEPKMEFKAVRLFADDLQDNQAPLFWLPYIPFVDCLSGETKKYPNGMLESLVLDRHADITYSMFCVAGILEHKVIVSLPVAESMLRRKMTGFTFVPVFFSEGKKKQEKE